MKILWLSHSAGAAGAERAMVESVKGLVEAGHQVTVALPSTHPVSDLWAQLRTELIQVHPGWWMSLGRLSLKQRMRGIADSTISGFQLARHLAGNKFDVAITNTLTVAGAALASRFKHVPHIWYIHEFGERDQNLLFHLGERASLRFIDRSSSSIIVNSPAVASHFGRRIPSSKIHLLDYAVEVSPATEIVPQEQAFRLVIVGYLHPGKRQADAIRAVAELARRGIRVALDIVGPKTTSYSEDLQRLAGTLGVNDRVHLRGASADSAAWFAAADVALMCSQNEAFGRVTVEAIKAGTPVIGTRSGGTVDLVDDGVTGLLYEPGNVSDLADKIADLHGNRELLESLGRNGQAWATQRFSLERHTRELLRIIEGTIAAG